MVTIFLIIQEKVIGYKKNINPWLLCLNITRKEK